VIYACLYHSEPKYKFFPYHRFVFGCFFQYLPPI
jgi:hypothetical protein